MIIVLKSGPTDEDIVCIEEHVRRAGYEPHTIRGEVRTVVAAVGDEAEHASLVSLKSLDIVENVLPIQKRYKLIARETHPETAKVDVGGQIIGGGTFQVIAGPCAVESLEQMAEVVAALNGCGSAILRGGAFKPRTSPYDFQGLKSEGLRILHETKSRFGLPVVSEVVRESDLEKVGKVADMLQIGARNAMNYSLLERAADTGKPVLLKRGMAQTVDEWLLSAEYLVKRGNRNIVLCERGIRTFETAVRNTLDLSAVALAKKECALPVIVDPSHAAGRVDLIIPLAKAAVAVGADGLIVEVHPHPSEARSDPAQQLSPKQFSLLMSEIRPYVELSGKKMPDMRS
jgi:3-deoxy-7-phosphoheptulonate synthase